MKKLILLFALFPNLSYAHDLWSDTKRYFASRLDVGYYEHYRDSFGVWRKEREGNIGFPLVASGTIFHMDAFSRIGSESSDFGFSFPLTFGSFYVAPQVFNNFSAKELGFGVQASFKFKKGVY